MNKNVLLLGGGGFIGTTLANHLHKNKFNVYIISKHFPLYKLNSEIRFYKGDIDSFELLNIVLPICGTVIHLASSGHIEDPLKQIEKNITPTLNFLNILQNYKNIHLIYISSGGVVYGDSKIIPTNEGCLLNPISFYGWGKVTIETSLRIYLSKENVTVVRPSNIYGPHQFFKSNFSGVIRTMFEHILNNTTMEIWGDGETIRDFLYIDDMISALMCLIKLPFDNNTYNIGSGIGYSINQLKEIIELVCNKKLDIIYKPGREIDVKTLILDSSNFIKRTKWYPSISLEQGIESTWGWLNGGNKINR